MVSEAVKVPLFLALNAASSIGIVYANKTLFVNYGFPYGTLLTVIHFVITFLGLLVCRYIGMFEVKRDVPIRQLLPLSLSFCGFVCLTNISLKLNSVGSYQLIKVLTTPLLLLIQYTFYGERFAYLIIMSLMLICVGVITATVSDTTANLPGTVVALSAVGITCMYQIWVGVKQKELRCDSFQLLYYQAPLSAMLLLPWVFILDDMSELYGKISYSTQIQQMGIPEPSGESFPHGLPSTVFVIVLSGLLAFLVNISIYLVIGRTSPVTYNVLGHFKLCVIMGLGFLFFAEELHYKNGTGILLTLMGVFWYTHIKSSKSTPPAAPSAADVAKKEDVEVPNERESAKGKEEV